MATLREILKHLSRTDVITVEVKADINSAERFICDFTEFELRNNSEVLFNNRKNPDDLSTAMINSNHLILLFSQGECYSFNLDDKIKVANDCFYVGEGYDFRVRFKQCKTIGLI